MTSSFPAAQVTPGGRLHYVDDYRSGAAFTICSGHKVHPETFEPTETTATCERCLRAAQGRYPDADEFFAYHRCTDCGADTWTTGEQYTLRGSVWKIAYPDYTGLSADGIACRPCLNCLEKRLGRELYEQDFLVLPTFMCEIA